MTVVEKYRQAAIRLWGMTAEEAAIGIVAPADDRGEWAPNSLAVIYVEGQTPINYWERGAEQCEKLSAEAGVGYIEFINAAVAAVYEA